MRIIGARATQTGGYPPWINWQEFMIAIQNLLELQIIVFGLQKHVVPKPPTSISTTVSGAGAARRLSASNALCRCEVVNGNSRRERKKQDRNFYGALDSFPRRSTLDAPRLFSRKNSNCRQKFISKMGCDFPRPTSVFVISRI